MHEIINMSVKLCALIHDLTSIHVRLRAEPFGLRITTCLTISMVHSVLALLFGPANFFFTMLPVVLRLWTHLKIILRLETVSSCPSLKLTWKIYCTAVIGFLRTHHTQTSYATVHCSVATNMALYNKVSNRSLPLHNSLRVHTSHFNPNSN